MSDGIIGSLLKEKQNDINMIAENLIDIALAHDGKDNVSIILLQYN